MEGLSGSREGEKGSRGVTAAAKAAWSEVEEWRLGGRSEA
jgi:hypothetical protein